MTIRHLKIFVAVAQTGKMSEAAAQLYITQPTVSQAIRELEEHYETLLFERISRRLYITDAGRELLTMARPLIHQFDLMEGQMRKENRRERFRLGGTVTVSNCMLADVVKDFRERNPRIEIYAYAGNTKSVEDKLLRMELDVGIVEGRIKEKELEVIPVIEDYLVLACSCRHPFAGRKILNVKELEGQEFVMRESGSGTRELFESYLEQSGVSIKTVFEENSPEAMKRAMLVNNCLAVISIRLLEREIKEGAVYVFKNACDHWKRYFSCVYHKDKYISESISCIRAIMEEYRRKDIWKDLNCGILTDAG